MAKLKNEWQKLIAMLAVFAICFFLPVAQLGYAGPLIEALHLLREYAREHILLCLIPALFIAGGMSVFINKQAVIRYLGAGAKKVVAYSVAGVSGAVLAVCSCTVLPLFAGICKMGAGIGPATAFLYAGPAINVLAVILTARVLGWRLGLARAGGAVVFAVVIGVLMQLIFREKTADTAPAAEAAQKTARPLWQNAVVLICMVVFLVFANWSVSGRLTVGLTCCPPGTQIEEYVEGKLVETSDSRIVMELPDGRRKAYPRELIRSVQPLESSWYRLLHRFRYAVAVITAGLLALLLHSWFRRDELKDWSTATWGFAKQILPLLFIGVLIAGFLLGRPNHDGIIPSRFVAMLVGESPDVLLSNFGWSDSAGLIRAIWPLWTNLFAAIVGAFMYFATLTEVPIVEGLRGAGMGDGPALALLLAGPALSLPNMLVIRSVIGTKKTAVYILLVITMATVTGMLFDLVPPG